MREADWGLHMCPHTHTHTHAHTHTHTHTQAELGIESMMAAMEMFMGGAGMDFVSSCGDQWVFVVLSKILSCTITQFFWATSCEHAAVCFLESFLFTCLEKPYAGVFFTQHRMWFLAWKNCGYVMLFVFNYSCTSCVTTNTYNAIHCCSRCTVADAWRLL